MSKTGFSTQFQWRRCVPLFLWVGLLSFFPWPPSIQAQWISQTNHLVAGWNSVYLHIDASHTDANTLLLAEPQIEEVWMWISDLPPSLTLATPPTPSPSPRWSQWIRSASSDGSNGALSYLKSLPGNAALLVKASSETTWIVKGRPVPPIYPWTLSGLNFLGFPTSSSAPTFEAFLTPDAQTLNWRQNAEVFRYVGGPLSSSNPLSLSSILFRNVPVVREQAYWIRLNESDTPLNNSYFGPFQIQGIGSTGIQFGERQGQTRFYLKNMTADTLTVNLQSLDSEASPSGSLPTPLPLMLRGSFNPNDLSFSYSNLETTSPQWTLAAKGLPGSVLEVVLGVDRSRMDATSDEFASVLRFTDSLGLSRVEIGASASKPALTGLWVGNALVDQVSQYLKSYAKPTNVIDFHAVLNQKGLTEGVNVSGTNLLRWATSPDGMLRFDWDTNTSLILITGTNVASGQIFTGSYLQDGPLLTDLAQVARPVPLRLIVHNDGTKSRLLQRAYLGLDSQLQPVVATQQDVVAGNLAVARRLSAVHLPTTDANLPWNFEGHMNSGETLQTIVDLSFRDQASNPFLHTYHPDHDNLNALYTSEVPSGQESYDLRRILRLTFTSPGNDFESKTRDGGTLKGTYSETISFRTNLTDGSVLKQFNATGTFSLTRITDTATLIQ